MMQSRIDPFAELESAARALGKNLPLAIIPAVGSLIIVAVCSLTAVGGGLWAMGAAAFGNWAALLAALGAMALGVLLTVVVAVIVGLLASAAAAAGAQSVWQSHPPDLGADVGKAVSRMGDLLAAGFLITLIAIAISWTIVGPVILSFFMLYVIPAIVVGGEGGIAAMGTSWRLATQQVGYTFAAFVGILAFSIVAAIASGIVGHIIVLGWLIAAIAWGLDVTFAALVSVRFYELLKLPSAQPTT